MEVTIKFLGGLRLEMGVSSQKISLPDNATVKDLEVHLGRLGFSLERSDIIIVLNNRGLRQWPPHQKLSVQDNIVVFPNISGG